LWRKSGANRRSVRDFSTFPWTLGDTTMTSTRTRLLELTALFGLTISGLPAAQAQCSTMAMLMVSRNYYRQSYYTPIYTPAFYNSPYGIGVNSLNSPGTPPYNGYGPNYNNYGPRSLNYSLRLYSAQAQPRYSSSFSTYSTPPRTMYQYHTSSYTTNTRYSGPNWYQPVVGVGHGRYFNSSSPEYAMKTTVYQTKVSKYTYPGSTMYTQKQTMQTPQGNQVAMLTGQYSSKQGRYQAPATRYQNPGSQYAMKTIDYSAPPTAPIPMKIPGMKLNTRLVETTTVTMKLSVNCGQCHLPKSSGSTPLQMTQPLRSTPSQIVKIPPMSSLPVVALPPQMPPPYPLQIASSAPLQMVTPALVPSPLARSSPATLNLTPPSDPSLPVTFFPAPRPKAVCSSDSELRTDRKTEPSRSLVTVVMTPPPLPLMLDRDLFTPPSSQPSQLTIAAAGRSSGRLLPDAVIAMPALPSGLPVLPPTEEDVSPFTAPSLLDVVLQPPPIPVERD
jgi:hypothetical protein